jgi:hypothetical protein
MLVGGVDAWSNGRVQSTPATRTALKTIQGTAMRALSGQGSRASNGSTEGRSVGGNSSLADSRPGALGDGSVFGELSPGTWLFEVRCSFMTIPTESKARAEGALRAREARAAFLG